RPAVIVEVRNQRAERVAAGDARDSGFLRDIGESAIAIVVVERVGSRRQPSRAAHNRQALPHAIRVAAFRGCRGYIKVDIMSYEQIELAVTIIVDKGAAGAPTWRLLVEPSLFSDVDEFALAVIPVKDVLSIVGHEYVIEAVVVKIADADSLAPAGPCEVCAASNVGEGSIPVIVVEVIGRFLAFREALE